MNTALPIVISILAFVLSAVTFYLTHFRRASLLIVAGEHINVSHFSEGNCGITLPVSITNIGARTATVQRIALLVQSAGSSEGYLLEPLFYQKIDAQGNFEHESQPTPIPIVGKGTETKQILFRSSIERPLEFQFTKPGDYIFSVLAWTKDSTEPHSVTNFRIILSESDASTLIDALQSKKLETIRLRQSIWRKWAAHPLTEVEVTALGSSSTQ